jgi:TRAP-type mannitol/chloroaromatic compound transport system substrate-binding protein
MGSYHQAMEFFEIIFNRTKYESLSPDLQAVLKYASEAVSSANTWKAQDNYSRDLQKLITKDGVKVSRTSKEIFQAQLKAWDKVTAKLVAEDEFFKKVYESQKAWARRVAYYNFFNDADYKSAYEHVFKTKLPA